MMDGFTLRKKDTIWFVVELLLLLYLFLPRSGETVIVYSICKAALLDVACVFLIIKFVPILKSGNRKQAAIKITIVLISIIVGLIAARNPVFDMINGPESMKVSNITVSHQNGTAGIFTSHYYLFATDSEGHNIRMEISGDDYTALEHTKAADIKYYENSKLLISYIKQ